MSKRRDLVRLWRKQSEEPDEDGESVDPVTVSTNTEWSDDEGAVTETWRVRLEASRKRRRYYGKSEPFSIWGYLKTNI